jgi:hypothetical protein
VIRPGFEPARMAALMRRAIDATGLRLEGAAVLTEAATGAYGCTPVVAALAGARVVHAVARDTRHGPAEQARAWVMRLAEAADAPDAIRFHERVPDEALGGIDLVTNSGHVRPIDAGMVARLPERAVVALMYEAWELRPEDIDVAACRRRGLRIAGVDERNPAVGVFDFLGPLAVRLLQDAGVAVLGSRIALLCDNDFAPHVAAGLRGLGADVSRFDDARETPPGGWDAVLVSLKPGPTPRVDAAAAALLGRHAPGAVVAQLWGDVDRTALAAAGLRAWPEVEPKRGHMGALLSEIGPEAIVRLQTGGMAAASELLIGACGPAGRLSQIV